MKDQNTYILLALFAIALIFLLMWKPKGDQENMTDLQAAFERAYLPDDIRDIPKSKDGSPILPPSQPTYQPGYLPSKHRPYPLYFQNLLPSLTTERAYHNIIADECDGNYGDFQCRQKSYIKTIKGGTTDKADLLCWRHRFDEDKYYGCLDAVYGDYIWHDRNTGAAPCLCKDGRQGSMSAYGSCDCPPLRPLHDRRPLDQNYEVVDRLHEF